MKSALPIGEDTKSKRKPSRKYRGSWILAFSDFNSIAVVDLTASLEK